MESKEDRKGNVLNFKQILFVLQEKALHWSFFSLVDG